MLKLNKFIRFILFLLITYHLPLLTGSLPLLYAGFDDTGISARVFGMGNTFIALSDDVNAMYYNPAGLAQLNQSAFGICVGMPWTGLGKDNELEKDTLANNVISFNYPIKNNIVLGLGMNILSLGSYYKENTLIVSGSKKINNKLMFGLNIKSLSLTYGSDNYTAENPLFIEKGYTKSGLSADIGGIYGINEKIKIGFVLNDILQPDMGLKQVDKIPLGIKLGGLYTTGTLNNLVDIISKGNKFSLQLGIEKWFNQFAVRGGFGFGNQEYKNISLGASYKIASVLSGLSIDYGFSLPLGGISGTIGSHNFNVILQFGKSEKEVKKQVKTQVIEQKQVIPEKKLEQKTVPVKTEKIKQPGTKK